jgi:membrane-bound lytic murein transglycosylase A
MPINFNQTQRLPFERPKSIKILLITVFIAPLIFTSCSIFKPKPDNSLGRSIEQTYKSQRTKKPNLSRQWPSSKNPPFWYREKRIAPKAVIPESKSSKSHSNQAHSLLSKNSFKTPKVFVDDLDLASLKQVILNQLKIMRFADPTKIERLGDLMVTNGWLKETLTSFLSLANENLSPIEFSQRLREEFVIHRVGKGNRKQVLFTGYYAPMMQASRVRTKKYRYPIYKIPESSTGPQLIGHSKSYKIQESSAPNSEAWRNYTRKQIDGDGILKGRGLEIAWLENDVDRFFLHIQGSGQLLFLDGTLVGAHFAGVNNYKFGGLGKRMIKDGVIDIAQGSMQGIKKYFIEYPEDIEKYLFQNKRYIFFKLANEGNPRGSGGGELLGGRSIATDKKVYPAGGLAFVKLRKPILDDKNEIIKWENFSRFVVDQDTGNAIRGTGRADFYFGIGDRAGAKAGRFHEWGEVFYIVKKFYSEKSNS